MSYIAPATSRRFRNCLVTALEPSLVRRQAFLRTYWPLAAGLAAIALLTVAYVAKFGVHRADQQRPWADFGNYLAGVVGPSFRS